MNEKTGISMIIATKGRVKLLENLILTIDAERSSYSGPTELIIVDDSNRDEALQVEAAFCRLDVVRIRRNIFSVAVRVLNGDFHFPAVLRHFEVDDILVDRIL